MSLGYSEHLPNASKFKRMHLTPLWHTLFSILNRCLTSKHTGIDRCSISTLRLFHGVAFNKHYDYATIFWNEFVELVGDKSRPGKARTFVPFQRFIQLIILNMMRANRDLPKREFEPVCPEYPMNYLRNKDEDPNVQPLQIPEALLAYADQDAPSVREYRQNIAPMSGSNHSINSY